jgi:tetraprenyl-beta-curcumene synthase
VVAISTLLWRYWVQVKPAAGRELVYWRRRAAAIPDPTLRAQALFSLREDGLNPEAAAVFATLAPRGRRQAALRALVAFQVMYDYLDTIGEQAGADRLGDGLALQRAFADALAAEGGRRDYYRHHPQREDGGYLEGLVEECRTANAALPGAAAVRATARRAAERAAAAQSHTHAAIGAGNRALAEWALAQDRAAGYEWWELAAGGIASLSVLALIAAAADPRTGAAEAAAVDAAYFPSVCSLCTMLDSLIDYDADGASGNHSAVAEYESNLLAAERLAAIAAAADAEVRQLRRGRHHAAILAGVPGFYLSAAGARTDFARPIATRVIARLSPMAPLSVGVMRARRRLRPG